MKKSILLTMGSLVLGSLLSIGQVKNLDRIVGRVGNNIILKSDVDILLDQQRRNDITKANTTECDVLQELMMRQILVAQAERDSVIVSDQEIEGRMEERLNYMISRAGSKENLEKQVGKSVYVIKEENRKFFKDELTASQMQQKLAANVKVTPFDVERYFNTLPNDSLPTIPASIMVGQLVFNPIATPEMEEYAKQRLEKIRQDIVDGGRSFETMAGIYGMDGTKNDGGNLLLEKDRMDPIFVSAAMRLQPGEISPVFRGKMGYHIVQMVQKLSNTTAKVKHIIIIPEITSVELSATKKLADSVYQELQAGKMTFAQAFNKYSKDDYLTMSGGYLTSQINGSVNLGLDEVDRYVAMNMDKIPVGGYSEPHNFQDMYGQQVIRIVHIKEKNDPHVFNLKDDYAIIQNQALMMKQVDHIKNFVNRNIQSFYIYIDPEYNKCDNLKDWQPKSNN